jgi:hypothetical protein
MREETAGRPVEHGGGQLLVASDRRSGASDHPVRLLGPLARAGQECHIKTQAVSLAPIDQAVLDLGEGAKRFVSGHIRQ